MQTATRGGLATLATGPLAVAVGAAAVASVIAAMTGLHMAAVLALLAAAVAVSLALEVVPRAAAPERRAVLLGVLSAVLGAAGAVSLLAQAPRPALLEASVSVVLSLLATRAALRAWRPVKSRRLGRRLGAPFTGMASPVTTATSTGA